ISFEYGSADGDPLQRGASASVGIEDEKGAIGFQYSYNQPVLESGLAVEFSLPPSGIVNGVVTSGNDGLPIAGASVRFNLGDEVVRTATTNRDGFYQAQVPVGSYQVTVERKGYGSQTIPVEVELNQILQRNFALQSGFASLSPALVQLVLPPGEVRTRTLTLSNTGTLGFDFEINESGGTKQQVTATRLLKRKATTSNSNIANTRDLYTNRPAAPISPLAAGDVLASWPVELGWAWGVGFANDVWLADIFAKQVAEFTPLGEPTGRSWSAPGQAEAIGDLAYDSTHNLMCQVDIYGGNGIRCSDPDTGVEAGLITGPWTAIDQRGLAYRPDDDSFYIAGWNDGVIYHIQGLSGGAPGDIISSCSPPDGSIAGLGWNPGMQVLWASTNSPTDTIYQLNPEDCTVLSTLAHPTPGGYWGAGLDVDGMGNLWTISQMNNTAYLIDSGVPAFNDVSWLSVSPEGGTVAPGAKTDLTVSVDTSGLTTGQYFAQLIIETGAPNQPFIRVPVTVIITDYIKALNAGGQAYTDSTGDPWVVDKKYTTSRGWGYIQDGKVKTTKNEITGTTDPVLFQSQRIDPYAYRFDNVPLGIYEIQLLFAELEKLKPNKRLFDVIVEDTTVLPAHDISYEV
ncbi:MAG TPA: carboxypeptidase regulatory-like domain-containing protein, partial [Polyangiaceae bacterium]|nr:carboxypeptidase regulatory-like domain-containing protein [Polyangiaceae bacterium]